MLQRSKKSAVHRSPPTSDTDFGEDWSGYRPGGRSATDTFVRGTAGLLLARPWFDSGVEYFLKRYFFPLSRLWAAAGVAKGSPERFFEAIPMSALFGSRRRVLKTLARFEKVRVKSKAMDDAWERVFFGNEEAGVDVRTASESSRLELRHQLGSMRRDFLFLTWNDVPRVKYEMPSVEAVEAIYGGAFESIEPFVEPPETMPEISVSRPLPVHGGSDRWLRFASPSERLGDTVYARVHEPEGVFNPPTIIFGHGVCVDFDHWQGLIDEAQALRGRGIRVIRPEAPWHGRRVLPGQYGGEKLVSTFPEGPLDMFMGAAREWSVLAHWARATSSGSLAFGGSSLGALTAQFVTDCASHWPERLRPDALFLVTHCGGLSDAMHDGQLVNVWGDEKLFTMNGWSRERIKSYLDLLNPKDSLCVSPDNIVSVLGSQDAVTPFQSGRDLVSRWGVPEENLFIWNRGHFTVPMTMFRDDAPLERLLRIMHQ